MARVLRILRTPVTLLVLLGILGYGAWWGYTAVRAPFPAAAPVKCVPQPVQGGKLRAGQVVVSVFNGGSKKGQAGDVGRSLRQHGFTVHRITNTAQKVDTTVVVGAGTADPEVLLVRRFFKKSSVRADQRVDHSVDVLVGDGYRGVSAQAKAAIKVQAGTVCLPPPAASTTKAPAANG